MLFRSGVGATTGLAPALTLGCGAVGGSATSDNITPKNLINIRRVAYGVRDLDSLREPPCRYKSLPGNDNLCEEDIEAITRAVLEKLKYK